MVYQCGIIQSVFHLNNNIESHHFQVELSFYILTKINEN